MKNYKLKLQRVIATGEEQEEAPFWDTVQLEKLPSDNLYEYPGKEGFWKVLAVGDIAEVTSLNFNNNLPKNEIPVQPILSRLYESPTVTASTYRLSDLGFPISPVTVINGITMGRTDLKNFPGESRLPETHYASYYLKTAQEAMQQRGQLRDSPTGERSMATIVATFNALTNHTITESEGWEFMVLLKMVRGRQGQFNADDYIDGSAYFGLLGECNAKDRT